ncbi:hypothetical protein RUND412_007082 [Rhizina undulata]
MAFTTPPPTLSPNILLTFPTPQILLVTLNRPDVMNCISTAGHWELDKVWLWYDSEPSMRCAVITGARDPSGRKRAAFCAGQDLKEWNDRKSSTPTAKSPAHPPSGFAGLSRRTGKKPVISAINGIAFGGGLELITATDLNLCTPTSTFALPEVLRGVAAFAGALPRLTLTLGLQRASELALTGRTISAREAAEWGLVNKVIEGGDVVAEAVKWAEMVAKASPDSVIVSRAGVRSAWEGWGVEEATRRVNDGIGKKLEEGWNQGEGLRSFAEKREPVWRDSKL